MFSAFKQFAEGTLRLVVFIAKKYHKHSDNLLTIIQFGNIGLLKAIAKFDFTTGYKFSTYAYWWIKQSIGRGLTNTHRTIRLPIHISDRLDQIKRVVAELQQTESRHCITELQIAHGIKKVDSKNLAFWIRLYQKCLRVEALKTILLAEFMITLYYEQFLKLAAEVKFCIDSDYKVSSTNITFSDDDGSQIQDLIVDDSQQEVEEEVSETRLELEAMMRILLDESERELLRLHFGMGCPEISLKAIAKNRAVRVEVLESELEEALLKLRGKSEVLRELVCQVR